MRIGTPARALAPRGCEAQTMARRAKARGLGEAERVRMIATQHTTPETAAAPRRLTCFACQQPTTLDAMPFCSACRWDAICADCSEPFYREAPYRKNTHGHYVCCACSNGFTAEDAARFEAPPW
jgi:hypothetical protein